MVWLGKASSVVLALAAPLLAQSWSEVPPAFANLPGNAGISLPARWSQGTLQVLWDDRALPAAMAGKQLAGLRMRRASFAGEGAWAARTIRARVSLANAPDTTVPGALQQDLAANRPAGLAVAAGPTTLSLPATAAPGPGTAFGPVLVQLPFAQPFAFRGPYLFLEWENADAALDVSADHWVEAFWMKDETNLGLAVVVGNAGCGSIGPLPMRLAPADDAPPGFGRTVRFAATRVAPRAATLALAGVDPETRTPPFGLPFGASLAALGAAGCHLWTGAELLVAGTAGPFGDLPVDLAFPDVPQLYGQRVGVQVVAVDPAANALGLAFSNGVVLMMNHTPFGQAAATVLAPGTLARSPWSRFAGMAPVVAFDLR
jgi:hypothetical protein